MQPRRYEITTKKPELIEGLIPVKWSWIPDDPKERAAIIETYGSMEKAVAALEETIPLETQSMIAQYIKDLRAKRTKERTIKRMVRRKFKIGTT